MGCKVEACAECTQNCLLIHEKRKDPSSIVTSFFKVMYGVDYSKFLYLPPKFARTVSALVDQKTHLEDSSGRQWTVTLSNHDGSLAFQEGWHEFSSDHGLEVGDFLVFNYIMGSHFVVQIYGRTGCQKLNISENNGNRKKKRSRASRNFIAEYDACHTIDNGSMNKQGSSRSVVSGSDIEMNQRQPTTDKTANFDNGIELVCATKLVEEPFYMIDRDAGYKQEEYRSSLFDLSNFEIQRSVSDAGGTSKVPSGDERTHIVNAMLKPRIEAGAVAKDKVAQMSEKGSTSGHSSGYLLEKSAVKPAENRNSSAAMLKLVTCQNAEERSNTHSSGAMRVAKKELMENNELCRFKEMFHGKKPKIINECGQSSSLAVKDNDEVLKLVKTEPVDSYDLSSLDAADISRLAVIGSHTFVEFSRRLPSISFSRTRLGRKVVFLRVDPDTKLWPVLYLEKYGFKVLTSGWESFSKANSIQLGDECTFKLENAPQSIFRVSKVCK